MVYECRKRLNRHSRKSDLAQKYTLEKQKPGEKATEFIIRLTALRTKNLLVGKTPKVCGSLKMLGYITWMWPSMDLRTHNLWPRSMMSTPRMPKQRRLSTAT
jgi:hypothetical protein